MKPQAALKIALDILMTLGLLFTMGYPFWGDAAHEWVGVCTILLWCIYHLLNGGWHRNLLRGRYPPDRVLLLTVDILLFLSMTGLIVSSALLSNHVFDAPSFPGSTSFARMLHMGSSYWCFVLVALHLGLHWAMMLGIVQKMVGRKQSPLQRKTPLLLLNTGIALYGLSVFFRRALPTYMLLQTQFVFLDFSEFIPFFYIDYLAMMGTFIYLAYYIPRFVRKWIVQ